ncbi:MAG: alpha-2-macroglobulin family protein, partial [Planctomycetota bacterium]
MQRIPRKFMALAGILVSLNVIGLVWIHHELTKAPSPTARILSMRALPNTEVADRLTLAFDRHMVSSNAVGQFEKAAIFKIKPELPGKWIWSAPDRLEYLLSKPLPLGRIFKISSTEELRHRTGRTLEGDEEFELRTSSLVLERFELVAFDRNHITYRVIFNQPVDPGDLLRHISFYDDKTTANLGEPTCITQSPEKDLIVRFRRPDSNRFRMVLDEQLTGYGAEIGLERPVVRARNIPKRFSLINAYARRPTLEQIASVELRFTHKLSIEQKLPQPTIVPPLAESKVYRKGSKLVISGKFKAGGRYRITVAGTLLSDDNKTLGKDKSISVLIPEYRPRFQFAYRSGFLSPLGNLNLDARAVNIDGLELNAWRVHANNLIAHLHHTRTDATSRSVLNKKIELDLPPGKPEKLVLDLQNLLPASTGIYCIRANATNTRWTSDSALVTITDLALTTKSENGGSLVWVTSLRTGEPVSDVEVKALTFNNQILTSSKTDENGIARLKFVDNHPDGRMWVITAEKDGDLSYLKPKDNQWVIDDVKQSGRPYVENYEVMLYTERGAYRPGDTIHLTGIIRERAGEIPPSFPLTLKVTRPDGRQVAELVTQPSDSNQGIFHADFPTRSDSQTGPYNFRVTLPGSEESLGSVRTLVEAFIPVRMEVQARPTTELFGPNMPPSVDVSARYLWDEPATALPVTVSGTLKSIEFESSEYPDYKFCRDKNRPKIITLPDSKGELDKDGKAILSAKLPQSLKAGLYRAWLLATVTELGGRSVSANVSATLDTLDRHIGLRLQPGQIVSIDVPLQVHWVRLTGADKLAPEGDMKMRMVRVEYDNVLKVINNRRVWKSVERTKQIGKEQLMASAGAEGSFEVVCPDPGTYRVILIDEDSNSTSYLEFYASENSAGAQSVPMNRPERLEIITDKEKYLPGQTVNALVRSPIPGTLLFTVENDNVVSARIYKVENNTAEVDVFLPDDLRGGVFLTGTVVRAVDPLQENWLPHRAIGTTRILIDHKKQQLPLKISGPVSAEPGETVSVTVDTGPLSDPNRPTFVHLWAVDDGILLTTGYQTPDSHSFFLGPRRLGVFTADIFLRLLPDHKRPVGTTRIGSDGFRIGSLRRNPIPAKIQKAAVIWQGAVPVDKNGQVTASFKLPELIGQMRFMAVAIDHDRYGQTQHSMTLTSPLIVETTWPRYVCPQDQFEVPIKLLNSTDKPLAVQLKTSLSGPVELLKNQIHDSVHVNPGQPTTVWLKVKAIEIGTVEALIEALELTDSNKPLAARSKATFGVRPAAALHSEVEIRAIKAGERLRIEPSQSFVEGTARMTVSISSRPSVQLGPALEDLIRYPYGCVEQTSSQLFSLLYASDILGNDRAELIDSMVKSGIVRLWSMQTRSGGLSYWPGGSEPSLWGTAYASSCLLEAKSAGHEIDLKFTSELAKYLNSRLRTVGNDTVDLNTKALICRVLAVFGEPPLGWMTRLVEQKDRLDLAAISHLAAAFHTAGRKDSALALLPKQLPRNPVRTTTAGRLTSPVRQQAVLLSVLLEIEP